MLIAGLLAGPAAYGEEHLTLGVTKAKDGVEIQYEVATVAEATTLNRTVAAYLGNDCLGGAPPENRHWLDHFCKPEKF